MRPCFALSACCLDRHPALKINDRDRTGTARLRLAQAARAAPGGQSARSPTQPTRSRLWRHHERTPVVRPPHTLLPSPEQPRVSPARSLRGAGNRLARAGRGGPSRLPEGLAGRRPRAGRGTGREGVTARFSGVRFPEPNSFQDISENFFRGGLRVEEVAKRG